MWRQTVVQKCIFDGKYTIFLSNLDKSGPRENLVGHQCSKSSIHSALIEYALVIAKSYPGGERLRQVEKCLRGMSRVRA
jgi:hypothetical protein